MSNAIDCSRMSHAACYGPEPESPQAKPQPATPAVREPASEGQSVSYDCLNECVSSLGVVSLLSGSVSALGCVAIPPACPVFVGAAAGSLMGGCHAACEDLESGLSGSKP